MNTKRLAGIVILIFIFLMGCSGNHGGILKTQSESESKVTQQELIDNWSDYDIWLRYSRNKPSRIVAIIFASEK